MAAEIKNNLNRKKHTNKYWYVFYIDYKVEISMTKR